MVGITEIPHKQQLHVMGSDRYSIRDTQIHDDVLGRFVEVDDIVENMDEEEQRKYDEAHKEYFESLDEIEKEKSEFLGKIKACVKPEHFQNILDEIEESENTGNYKIIDQPEGEPQYNKEVGYTIWIYQRCGACGDDYYGTICVKLPNDKYFIWDFEM